MIQSKAARSPLLPAYSGGPGPQSSRQLIRYIPGPRGGCCAPARRILRFRRTADPAVAAGPLLFSEQTSRRQPLLEADVSVLAAERGSVQIPTRVWVPGPGGSDHLRVQALPLAAGGAGVPLSVFSLNGPPQDGFRRQIPGLSFTTVHLSRARRHAWTPADALLLGGPATCQPSDGAVVRQWSFVCHAHRGL